MSPLVRCYSFLSLRFLSYLLATDSRSSQGASIVANGLNTILDDKPEYAVAAVEENRRQAEPSQQAQPAHPGSTNVCCLAGTWRSLHHSG